MTNSVFQRPATYLRKYTSEQEFTVLPQNSNELNEKGRVVRKFTEALRPIKFQAIITPASQKEMEKFKMDQHPATHTITHMGEPVAKATDMLTSEGKKYYITGVEVTNKIWYTVYFVEMREIDNVHTT